MSGLDIGGILSGALGGGLLSATGFLIAFASRLTRISTQLDAVSLRLSDHMKDVPRSCPAHEAISALLNETDKRVAVDSTRIDKLEGK
jgi:hypothetical protein